MTSLVWHQHDNIYTAAILAYKAVIIEQASQKYVIRLGDNNNVVLRDELGEHTEFEEAERLAVFIAVDLEQMGDKELAKTEMLKTLEFCQSLFPELIHPSHLQRLENIRQWVVNRITHENEMRRKPEPPAEELLNWTEQESNLYFANTSQGNAVVEEEIPVRSRFRLNPISTYKARIEHSTGAVYKSLETFSEFENAEDWVQQTLAELQDSRIAEYYLSNIHFTLSICRSSLPPNADPVHLARLEYLEMCMDDALL